MPCLCYTSHTILIFYSRKFFQQYPIQRVAASLYLLNKVIIHNPHTHIFSQCYPINPIQSTLFFYFTCNSDFNIKYSLSHGVLGFDGVNGWIRAFWWRNAKLRHSLCIDNLNPRGYRLIVLQPSDFRWRFSLEESDAWDQMWGVQRRSKHQGFTMTWQSGYM